MQQAKPLDSQLGTVLGPILRAGAAAMYALSVVAMIQLELPVFMFIIVCYLVRTTMVWWFHKCGFPADGENSWLWGIFERTWHNSGTMRRDDYMSLFHLAAIGTIFIFESYIFVQVINVLPLGIVMTVFGLAPLFAFWYATILRGEWPSQYLLWSSMTCTIGITLIHHPWDESADNTALWALLLSLLAAASEGAMPFFNDALTRQGWPWYEQAPAVATLATFFGIPVVGIGAYAFVGDDLLEIGRTMRLYYHHAAWVVPSILGFAGAGVIMTVSFAITPDVLVAVIAGYSEVLFSFIVQVTLLHEATDAYQLVGSAIVICGLIPAIATCSCLMPHFDDEPSVHSALLLTYDAPKTNFDGTPKRSVVAPSSKTIEDGR